MAKEKKSKLDCGCCKTPEEALKHYNYPGKDEIDYRLSKHSGFKRRMLHKLGRQRLPEAPGQAGTLTEAQEALQRPMLGLSTRADDDPSISLIDAWAVTADVLAFYQERIANEGYLRTATERMSVLELARAIGYELNPGVAAGTYLVFTVDEADAAPGEAEVAAGTQVQSIPKKQGELPQTFETTTDFKAYKEWNSLTPRTSYYQTLSTSANVFYLEGTNLNLKSGDWLLISTGDSEVFKRIQSVIENSKTQETTVHLTTGSTPSSPSFGYSPGIPGEENIPFSESNVKSYILEKKWLEGDLQVFLSMNQWDVDDFLAATENLKSEEIESDVGIFSFEDKAGIFGNTAPLYKTLPSAWVTGTSAPYQHHWDNPQWQIWHDSRTNAHYTDVDIYLDKTIDGLANGSWIVLRNTSGTTFIGKVKDANDSSITGFALNSKVTGIDLWKSNSTDLTVSDKNSYSLLSVRNTTVFARSLGLDLAQLPDKTKINPGDTEITLSGMVLGLEIGQPLALTGEQADASGVLRSEILLLSKISHEAGYTTLTFSSGLKYGYLQKTVSLNANVAAATHGETVRNEVLGSGDGSAAHQKFILKKNPLTHVSAKTSSGAKSTLEIREDGVRWKQVKSLYGLSPTSKAYTIRIDDDAKSKIIFGDSKKGARLPTGQQNITASYRSGIGIAGEVDAGSLTLLKTRPYGVKGVENPQDTSGAADPEKLANARQNAPLSVLTLDRIVSLSDYEDFARSFSGIGKAFAVAFWNGEQRLVHITIADTNGDVVETTSDLYKNLLAAIDNARDPLHEVRLGSFLPVYFDIEGRVWFDEDYLWKDVKRNIETALKTLFAFDMRSFAQPVSAAEIIAAIHTIDAVKAVDLEKLQKLDLSISTPMPSSDSPIPSMLLEARRPTLDNDTGDVKAAELLMINNYGIKLSEMDEH